MRTATRRSSFPRFPRADWSCNRGSNLRSPLRRDRPQGLVPDNFVQPDALTAEVVGRGNTARGTRRGPSARRTDDFVAFAIAADENEGFVAPGPEARVCDYV